MERKPNKKWNNNTQAQRRGDELKDAIKGFLIMTDRNKEKNSIRDAYNLLNDVIEEHFSPIVNKPLSENDNNKDSHSQKKGDDFDREIQQAKAKKSFFYSFDTHCNGVVFIKIAKEFEEQIDPIKVATIIINKVKESKQALSKTITKFLPIELAIKAKLELFKEKAPSLLQKHFTRPDEDEEQRKRSWKLEFRSRNNNAVSKEAYISFVSETIGREHYYVDYKNPEMTVLLEITNDLLCLSVLENYLEFKGYNIQALAKTEEELANEKQKLVEMQNMNKSKAINGKVPVQKDDSESEIKGDTNAKSKEEGSKDNPIEKVKDDDDDVDVDEEEIDII